MAKNVQGVLFLRNNTPYQTREAALTGIQNHKGDVGDGEFILARYNTTENNATIVKTLVGVKYGAGSTTADTLTIIDIEGASADVQELREQMEATFGTGVTTANTATAQLAALSGNAQSTSAETSVAGAKAYAEDLIGTLDGGVTADTGYFVKSVSEVDGKISGTTEALPSVTDAAVAKKFVTQVSETNGEIAVSRGEITSSAKTIVLNDNTDGGIDFDVNIDNSTIVKDADTGVISVASAALTQYVGDEDTIHISAVDATTNTKTISSLLTISATTPSEANVKEQYNLVGASGNTIGATIKIYKDSALLSVALLHAITTENPQVLPTYNKATDTWTDIPAAAQTEANQALCYAYEDVSGNTVVAAVPVGSFINEQEFASGVTWDLTAGKVRGVVDPDSEKDRNNDPFLTVDANGFKVDGIKDEIAAQLGDVVADLDATVTGATSGNHITISIEELDGKLVQSGLTIEEDDIASASDLEELSGQTVSGIVSNNSSITATINDAAGNKQYNIETDASKIEMSGFTVSGTSALSGISNDDSIAEAFDEVNKVITENEKTVAAALTDLNDRVDTISGDVETIEEKYVSGVTVNGSAVTVSDHVAPISISSATGATTGETNAAITVDTNANGAITLGLNYIDCGTYDDEP